MYHNHLISKAHPQQAELEKAVGLVLAFSAVSSVYFSPHLEDGLNDGIILIIIGEDSPHAWDELNESHWKVFNAFPQFSFRIFSAQWVRDELKDGNPFFAMHCTKNSLVYSTEETVEFTLVEKRRPRRFLKKAKAKFEKETNAVFMLGISLKYYQRHNDLLQAAYNIHQGIRWLFIAAENFLTGEWLVAQDLGTHQHHLARFSKKLGSTFSAHDGHGALPGLLNAACAAVQDGHEIPGLTPEHIAAAQARKDWLCEEVNRLFSQCLHRCSYEFSRAKSPLVTIDGNGPLQIITQIVSESASLSALWCIGSRTVTRSSAGVLLEADTPDAGSTHYYLFMVVKDFTPDAPGNIAFKVKSQTGGRCTATVIMHTKKSLRQKGDQQHFFHQIMQRGQLLYRETLRPPFLPHTQTPQRDIPSAKAYWVQRDRTNQFLMEAEALDGGGATKIHVYLMALVIEQTCLGLIRIFLGYTPNHFSLSYLFELCEYFTPLTAEIFPRTTNKDKELLRTLSGRTTSLRHGYVDDVPYHDYEVLSNRYCEFVDRAGKLATAELERLEKTTATNTQNN